LIPLKINTWPGIYASREMLADYILRRNTSFKPPQLSAKEPRQLLSIKRRVNNVNSFDAIAAIHYLNKQTLADALITTISA
jgi:hypothetical protein